MEPPFVGVQVIANFRVLGQIYVPIDDGAADPRVPPDIHMIVQNTIAHVGITVHAHIVSQH